MAMAVAPHLSLCRSPATCGAPAESGSSSSASTAPGRGLAHHRRVFRLGASGGSWAVKTGSGKAGRRATTTCSTGTGTGMTIIFVSAECAPWSLPPALAASCSHARSPVKCCCVQELTAGPDKGVEVDNSTTSPKDTAASPKDDTAPLKEDDAAPKAGGVKEISNGVDTGEREPSSDQTQASETKASETKGSETSAEDGKPRSKVPTEAKMKRRSADWKKAETLRAAGSIHEGKVEACNSGGLIVRYMSLLGFLPLSQVDPTRVPADGSKTIADVAKEMVGQNVKVKIEESNEETKRLLFSEKAANHALKLREIIEGEVYEGVVNGVTDYGAFVNLKGTEETRKVSGLVHISELSWDMVRDPKDVVQVGQEVKVKVVSVDRTKGRLALSIKQLQADPLFETLDTLMPKESQGEAPSTDESSSSEAPDEPLPGLEPICEELLKEDGISAVSLGRQANEKRVVSQDLELWVSNERVENGSYTLLARAGRQVQEVQVTTTLDKEGIKAAVQRVTGRVE